MRVLSVALGVAILGAVIAVGCGGGQQSSTTGGAPVDVTLTTTPDPPTTGDTTFEAMVMMSGQPVTDADVSVELFMAAMPAMKMPEMRNSVALTHEGGGRYRGTGTVMMAGSWDATVSVRRNGQEIGGRKMSIVAK